MMQKFDAQDRTVRVDAREERSTPRLRLRIEELEARIAPDGALDPPVYPPPLP